MNPIKFRVVSLIVFVALIAVLMTFISTAKYYNQTVIAVCFGVICVGFVILQFIFWRCPHCRRFLPSDLSMRYCPYCQGDLHETKKR